MRRIALLIALLSALPAAAAQCVAHSGPRTTALVELYTSEGCSSCPPADRWLSRLGAHGLDRVVPIALHVDYWDYIGWKDPYAKREFAQRQRKLTQLQRLALIYTPQVMLQGRDFRGWGTAAFEEALARIHAQPAQASLALEVVSRLPEGLRAVVRARLLDPQAARKPALYLAAYGNRLESRVAAGENRGRTLRHDYVVLHWEGPFRFSGAELAAERVLALPPGVVPTSSGVAAFVQDRASGRVLQALMRPAC